MLCLETKLKDQTYIVSIKSNGIIVGEFVKLDGLYYFSENKNRSWGFWSEEFLRSLTTELEKLNKDLDQNIIDFFNFQ